MFKSRLRSYIISSNCEVNFIQKRYKYKKKWVMNLFNIFFDYVRLNVHNYYDNSKILLKNYYYNNNIKI